MNYTAIGDTVNVASRLEGLTKNYDCKILVNDQVYEEIKDLIPCVDLGPAKVKGKGESIHIYGVPDPAEQRRHERLQAAFDVSYGVADQLYPGHALDISESGVAIAGEQGFPLESALEIHCRLADEWVKVHGVVRRLHGKNLGVEFVNIGEHERMRIRTYVKSMEMQGATAAKTAVATGTAQ